MFDTLNFLAGTIRVGAKEWKEERAVWILTISKFEGVRLIGTIVHPITDIQTS